eukprot:TRINITY_DN9866_c0_g1_i2.p1 TRINITY_DN9866_c0_g1~~TRINITY_DN9866_c0_g1_i2.p1  ORF type:complete len:133 (-),score=13.95 TRINITY_DN9866_c0_g1_i2:12-410(-)
MNWRMNLVMMMTLTFTAWKSKALRCYTDLDATRSGSLECGMATGCVKILKKAYELDHLGKFIPKNKRGEDVDLFRGCFLIAAPDVCFDAKDGLTYCWCSSGDLCNDANIEKQNHTSFLTVLLFSSIVTNMLG